MAFGIDDLKIQIFGGKYIDVTQDFLSVLKFICLWYQIIHALMHTRNKFGVSCIDIWNIPKFL